MARETSDATMSHQALMDLAEGHDDLLIELATRVADVVRAVEGGVAHARPLEVLVAFVEGQVLPHIDAEEHALALATSSVHMPAESVPMCLAALTAAHERLRFDAGRLADAPTPHRAMSIGCALTGLMDAHVRVAEAVVARALATRATSA